MDTSHLAKIKSRLWLGIFIGMALIVIGQVQPIDSKTSISDPYLFGGIVLIVHTIWVMSLLKDLLQKK